MQCAVVVGGVPRASVRQLVHVCAVAEWGRAVGAAAVVQPPPPSIYTLIPVLPCTLVGGANVLGRRSALGLPE